MKRKRFAVEQGLTTNEYALRVKTGAADSPT